MVKRARAASERNARRLIASGVMLVFVGVVAFAPGALAIPEPVACYPDYFGGTACVAQAGPCWMLAHTDPSMDGPPHDGQYVGVSGLHCAGEVTGAWCSQPVGDELTRCWAAATGSCYAVVYVYDDLSTSRQVSCPA